MKLELSHRDIELILSVMYETAGKSAEGPLHSAYTVDDLVLIDKLEAALKRVELLDEDALTMSAGDLYH